MLLKAVFSVAHGMGFGFMAIYGLGRYGSPFERETSPHCDSEIESSFLPGHPNNQKPLVAPICTAPVKTWDLLDSFDLGTSG